MIKIRCFTWSNARIVSNTMNPASSSPDDGAFRFDQTASKHGSNQLAASYPRKPTAPPVKRGSPGTTGAR